MTKEVGLLPHHFGVSFTINVDLAHPILNMEVCIEYFLNELINIHGL